jgi:hypothetical protein
MPENWKETQLTKKLSIYQRFIVALVESICTILDRIPSIERDEGRLRFYRYGDWGCRYDIARKSFELEEKWSKQ